MYILNQSTQEIVSGQVHMADGPIRRALGVIRHRGIPPFSSALPYDYALIFPFRRVTTRGVHMVFVSEPLDVVWLVGSEVVAKGTLPAWTGSGAARADAVIEFPAGGADEIEVGDDLVVVDEMEKQMAEKGLGVGFDG